MARLEALASPVQLAAGGVLIASGGVADSVFVLAQGVVRIFHTLAEFQFTVKLLRAPDAVGLVEALRGTRWVASAAALTPVEGRRLPVSALRDALASDHRFAIAVLTDMSEKFEGTLRTSRALGFDSCERRLIRVLLEYAEHFGRPAEGGLVIRYPLSRQRLAQEIGAARRSVDRVLASLTREGLLSLSPKGWQVLHAPELLRTRLHGD